MEPYALAKHHGIEWYPIDELAGQACSDAAAQQFLVTRQTA